MKDSTLFAEVTMMHLCSFPMNLIYHDSRGTLEATTCISNIVGIETNIIGWQYQRLLDTILLLDNKR